MEPPSVLMALPLCLRRKLLQTQDRVYANVWTLLQPAGKYTPSSRWTSVSLCGAHCCCCTADPQAH